MKTYTPSPLNAENITLPDNLTELTEAMDAMCMKYGLWEE